MERLVKISTPGRKVIYGRLRGALRGKLVIFVHGLSGHMDEHLFFNGARFFERHGFPVFRFNQYGYREGERSLQDVTLKVQAHDLDAVVSYWRQRGVKKFYVIGHSYGGPTIACAQHGEFERIVLWDPTYDTKLPFVGARVVSGRGYLMPWGVEVLVGRKMLQEALRFKITPLLKTINSPLKLIYAGLGGLLETRKRYLRDVQCRTSFVVIPGATHSFDEDGAEERLFHETLTWFKAKLKP